MPLLETKGAASAQGFGGAGAGASGPVTYIEDVFSTWLYTGNGSTQTINNGIDLSGKGGLVWIKGRSGATDHALYDTTRGATKDLVSNSTAAETTQSTGLTAFNGTGFSIGALAKLNTNAATYVSWTFREQPKFFDVVTYTGNGSAGRTISHNLGSYPGCIIVKKTSAAENWLVWHRSLSSPTTSSSGLMWLNTTNAEFTGVGSIYVPSGNTTTFTVASGSDVNQSGATYVAYLFAHNAGGFGLTGTDNVISCGSFTTDASGVANVTLGYEPQFVMVKPSSAIGDWVILDTTRVWAITGGPSQMLKPNTSAAEANLGADGGPNATGFGVNGVWLNTTCIYVAIRKGPMKVPTNGTSVFGLNARSGTGANATVTGGQLTDAIIVKNRGSAVADLTTSRLIGGGTYLITSSTTTDTNAGSTVLTYPVFDVMDGFRVGSTSNITNASGETYINYLFQRAPGFFDVVCYTGTGVARTVNHNLGVAPELMIVKLRSNAGESWTVWNSTIAAANAANFLWLNSTSAIINNSGRFNSTAPTSTVFTVGNDISTNNSGYTYVAYLFATCAGVSKVGSYTGTGALQTVNCGFTGGARFVLIKRTDSTGDWYVYDSARGISSGNDPYLLLNSTAAEVTGTNYVDTTSVGFQVTAAAPAGLNANGGTYIFLAIA